MSSHDEASLLPRCLGSIAFCDEIIVIDVDSSDETAATAEALGAHVVAHSYVPIAEAARATVAPQARHDWLLVVDPDEEVTSALATEVAAILPTLADDVAAVDDPPASTTSRGDGYAGRSGAARTSAGCSSTAAASSSTGRSGAGCGSLPGKRVVELPFTDETAIVHRWARGYRELYERHRRYLKLEPVDRAAAGEITGWRAVPDAVAELPRELPHESRDIETA